MTKVCNKDSPFAAVHYADVPTHRSNYEASPLLAEISKSLDEMRMDS